jgi:xylulokinase
MEALVAMHSKGLYAATVAKKRAYWPRNVPGDEVLAHMAGKPVGELHARRGTLGDMRFNLFAVNHNRYTFILIATYGSTVLENEARVLRCVDGRTLTFRRNEPLNDYYRARHAVDDHNHYRQGQRVSLEQAWGSKFWPNRQFAFVVATAMVNALMAYNHFDRLAKGEPALTLRQFQALVAEELIRRWEHREKEAEPPGRRPKRAVSREHNLTVLATFEGAVPGKRTQAKYQQVRCKGENCKRMIRTYCSCNRLRALCQSCFTLHVAEVVIDC